MSDIVTGATLVKKDNDKFWVRADNASEWEEVEADSTILKCLEKLMQLENERIESFKSYLPTMLKTKDGWYQCLFLDENGAIDYQWENKEELAEELCRHRTEFVKEYLEE